MGQRIICILRGLLFKEEGLAQTEVSFNKHIESTGIMRGTLCAFPQRCFNMPVEDLPDWLVDTKEKGTTALSISAMALQYYQH